MQGHIKQHKLGAEVKVGKRTDTDQSSASPFPLGNTKYLLWFCVSSKFKLTFVWRTSHTPPNPYGVLGGRVPSGMGRSRDSSPSRSPTTQERTSISQTYLTSKIYFVQSWWITGILGFEGWGIGIFFCVCVHLLETLSSFHYAQLFHFLYTVQSQAEHFTQLENC